jgi:predicted O-methyltransferase YrrM
MRWWQPSPSKEIKPVPWLSPEVIRHLDNLIQPDWEIIEHGSGGSTLWFAQKCKRVIACEHDANWRRTIQEKAPENVIVMGARIPEKEKPGGAFDLLLIDGEPVQNRAEWIQWSSYLVKPGGWVVLDNANRPEYAQERRHLQEIAAEFQTFDGNEMGTLYLVTEFYHMPEAEQPKKEKKARRANRK